MPLTWSHTFDPGPDFTARDGAQSVGRIYRFNSYPQEGLWLWSVHGIHMTSGTLGFVLSGKVESKEEAVEAVRLTWERAQAWSEETGRPLVLSKGYVPRVKAD